MILYTITDWASIVAVLTACGFAIVGLVQLIKRRSLWKVDSSILLLGGFYIIVLAAYLFFEQFIVNYRPVLIDGYKEASYPSSTTMLVLCIMVTGMMQIERLIKNRKVCKVIQILAGGYTIVMIVGRVLSGVHWFTDIIGGALLSMTLVMRYYLVNRWLEEKIQKKVQRAVEGRQDGMGVGRICGN